MFPESWSLFLGGMLDGEWHMANCSPYFRVHRPLPDCPHFHVFEYNTVPVEFKMDHEEYVRVELHGHEKTFAMYVPVEHDHDGDWVMQQLVKGYRKTEE